MKALIGLLAIASVMSSHRTLASENPEMVQIEAKPRDGRQNKQEVDPLEEAIEYIKAHDVVATLPGSFFEGSTLKMSPRNLDDNELLLSLKFSDETQRTGKVLDQEEGRKAKLKKIIVPVLVFVLLKAMTLVPLALGVLGIKAWNALQLSFFSFVVSLALAVFQLCKKLASDHAPGPLAAHGPWDNYQAAHYAARAFPRGFDESDAQELAYKAHTHS